MKLALEKLKPPKPNNSKMERLAIKSLQHDKNFILLPADKGNVTIVMDKVQYSNKLADLIASGGYCNVKKNPMLKTERKLSQILNKNKDLIPQKKYRQLTHCGIATTHVWPP